MFICLKLIILLFLRPGDFLWDVPVVLYLVWTLVLFISSLIVLSCLNRETKKFNKRVQRADNRVSFFLKAQLLYN